MATAKTRTKTAIKKGFGSAPEPKLGSGYSLGYTHALLALLRKKTGLDIDEIVALKREMEQSDKGQMPRVTRKELFNPPIYEGNEPHTFEERHGDTRHRMFSYGFWQIAISTSKGVDAKRPVFTVNTWAGESGWMHHADQIELGIVSSIDRKAYDTWCHAVMADWGSLCAVMQAACEWLNFYGYSYAWSWSSSVPPSQARYPHNRKRCRDALPSLRPWTVQPERQDPCSGHGRSDACRRQNRSGNHACSRIR